jgi:hypothetical protein
LVLLDLNNNFKKLYEDNMWDGDWIVVSFWVESLNRFELLSNWRLKLFLRSKNSKWLWYNFSKIIDKTGKEIKFTSYNLKETKKYGNKIIRIYGKYTWRKYIWETKNGKSRYFLMKNDNDFHWITKKTGLFSNIFKETKVKITVSDSYWNEEKTIFEKAWPEFWNCQQDDCLNSVFIKWIFNNKLFFISYVNSNWETWEYKMQEKYIYDFNKKRLIKKDFWSDLQAWLKWVYFIRNNWTIANWQNNKLILLDNNYNEKVLYEDSAGNYDDEKMVALKWSETLEKYELLSNWKIKLFLRWDNSKWKWYVYSKIIEIK